MGYALRIDTLKIANDLEKAGANRKLATAFTDAIAKAHKSSDLATKQDLREEITRSEMRLREDIANVRNELKGDINLLDKKIDGVRNELKEDIANVHTELVVVKGDIKSLNLVGVLILGAILAQLTNSIFKIW